LLGTLTLNGGSDIALNMRGGGDKSVSTVNANITDNNGCQSLVSATAAIYLSSVAGTYGCTADDNNCYQITTGNCVISGCAGPSGTTATYTCTAGMKYYAIPTDVTAGNPWEPDNWISRINIFDGTVYTATTSSGVEVLTTQALDVLEPTINFGSNFQAGENTGTSSKTTNVMNIGNSPINSDLYGTNMNGNPSGTLGVANIEWSLTNQFPYTSGTDLLTSVAEAPINALKPTSTIDVIKPVYWGIGIPYGSDASTYTGLNTFSAVIYSSGW